MRKGILIFLSSVIFLMPVMAANYVPKQFANTNTGEGIYPYSLNNRRQQPKTNNAVAPIGGGVRPMQQTGKRTVVKRPVRARAASTQNTNSMGSRRVVPRPNAARSAMNTNTMVRNTSRTIDNRGRSARGTTVPSQMRSATNIRRTNSSAVATNTKSSNDCFAGYKECMESYCKREDTAYNRCYCSAKLAQIDQKYQSTIDSLVQKIIKLQYNTDATSEEIKTYWNETVGTYTGTNPWEEIETALNIDWPTTESRIRGQNAFNVGHQYCVNYLRSCSYMASNLRDAYKSEISRDCAAYEDSLRKIKNAAESVIERYGQ